MAEKGNYHWNDIKEAFDDTLLLGNGASIAISERFRYSSLLDKAVSEGFLDEEAQRLFDEFETKDFEYILRMLMIANKVNELVGNKDPITKDLYEKTRSALIQVVQAIHLSHAEAESYFHPIAEFLSGFRTIFSLNYDLIVYWAIMTSNSHFNDIPSYFKDCMLFDADYGYNGEIAEFWGEFRERHQRHPDKKPVLVFYPHGNLGLVTPIFGRDRKIARDKEFLSQDLLSMIISEWERGDLSPLFVSEGNSEQKKWAIQRSDYLRTVYNDVMANEVGGNIVIYGFGMKDNDDHITDVLLSGNVARLAFALHGESHPTRYRVMNKVREIERATGKEIEVLFFNSDDDGGWVYPKPEVEK